MTSDNGRTRKRAGRTVRCAVYTRKSTDEGLDRDFNSLDAQREAAEAYIRSQRESGWVALAARYDDGGFTGANLERPALKCLLADIAAGRIDCILVYKVDRLSRSLLDFARVMEVFEKHHVSFVSVTQQFNTGTSMGRLVLNVLLSFAQFEREMISERTRDKMGAARRKGKWLGSTPVLGYDADRDGRRLIVNSEDAERVRAIFRLFAEIGSLAPTARELARRGWLTKRSITRRGSVRGGRSFNKSSLHYLLTNATYIGQVSYKGQLYDGEHEAIVPLDLFHRAQTRLRENRRSEPEPGRTPIRGLLRGMLFCATCGSRMSHTYSCKGSLRYRYYACPRPRANDGPSCLTGLIPAPEIERRVLEQVRLHLTGNPDLAAWPDEDSPKQVAMLRQIAERVEYDAPGSELTIRLNAEAVRTSALPQGDQDHP